MTDEDAFLRAIAADPHDRAPRLVYADWLDEHGRPDRAEFLRLQGGPFTEPALRRLREVAPRVGAAWAGRVNPQFPVLGSRIVVVRPLAQGDRTHVYEAACTHPDVAHRPLLVRVLRETDQAGHFLNTCRVHAQVQHGHIPPMYEVCGGGESGYYAVRAFVDGEDLHNTVRAGPLDPPAVTRVVAGAASALAAVHARGFVHGSIVPKHLIHGRDGSTWLIGLGEYDPQDVRIQGPLHLAPEQLEPVRAAVGPPTDVYQLAQTAAWLLTGSHPFRHVVGLAGMLAAKRAADGAVIDAPGLSGRVRDVLYRAMSPAPARRYEGPEAFAAALAGAGPGPRRWWWRT